jgi:hypothetical protein
MPTEDKLLERLDRAVRASRVADTIERTTLELGALLTKDPRARLAWPTVPLNVYGHLPDEIASSWVFVLRANSISGAERHPNSIQRVMSYRGSADLQTWDGRAWESHCLSSSFDKSIDERWLSIPTNVWHRPIMNDTDWTVVSFHTAAPETLIEERAADDENPGKGSSGAQLYEGRTAR